MRTGLAIAAAGSIALLMLAAWSTVDDEAPTEEDLDLTPDWQDEVARTIRTLIGSPVATMQVSAAGREHIKQREALRLTRYRLGDGGWTIGYGRYYRDGGELPPERITRDQAEAWFDEDLEQRGARWVRAYVTRPLQQHEFDALVSMAYNLKPSSFRTIAEAVNHFEDPEAAAMKFIRAGTHLERGLRNRRASELAMFRGDTPGGNFA